MAIRTLITLVGVALLAGQAFAQRGGRDAETPEQLRQAKVAALQVLVNQGNDAFRREDFGGAEALYLRSLEADDPALSRDQTLIVHGNLANARYRMEHWADAIASYRRSEVDDAVQWVAQCHVQLGNLPEAAFALRSALVLFPDRTGLRAQLAQIAAMLGRNEESLGLYEQLLEESPTDAGLHRLIATRHVALGNTARAIDALEMSWRLGGRASGTARLLGDLYLREGMRLEAASYYRIHLSLAESSSAEDYFRIGFAYYQSGETVSARGFFSQAVEADPTYADGFLYLGHLAVAEGDDEIALRDFGRAIEEDSALVGAHEAIGGIEWRRGNHDRAAGAFARALSLGGARVLHVLQLRSGARDDRPARRGTGRAQNRVSGVSRTPRTARAPRHVQVSAGVRT